MLCGGASGPKNWVKFNAKNCFNSLREVRNIVECLLYESLIRSTAKKRAKVNDISRAGSVGTLDEEDWLGKVCVCVCVCGIFVLFRRRSIYSDE